MRCALFFGSFNPIHFGHINIAKYLITEGKVDEVRLIVSPHNPCKDLSTLQDGDERLKNVIQSIAEIDLPPLEKNKIKVSDVEFHLSEPLYTINTLNYLKNIETENDHILVIGGDNIRIIERWYHWREILQNFEVWVYPRGGLDDTLLCEQYNSMPGIKGVRYLSQAPIYDISSTDIRNSLSIG